MQLPRVKALLRLATSLSLLFVIMTSHAVEWTIQPGIAVSTILTDNVRLAPPQTSESDLITTLTPGISITGETKRMVMNVNYRAQGIYYKNNTDDNDINHLLDAGNTTEIFKDRIFLDLSSTISQQNVSYNGGIPVDSISLSDDTSSVITYRVSPSWREQIGSFMNAEFRYERNGVESSRSFDSEEEIFSYNVSSGPAFTRLLWDIRLSQEEVNNDGLSISRFRNATAEAQLLLTAKLAVKGVGGYDDNNFNSIESKNDGSLWRAGFVLRPSRRTSLEATAGKRFFGTDIDVNISHRTRMTRWVFTYYRRPDNTRSILFEQQVFQLIDIFGDPLIDPDTSEPVLVNVAVPVQTDEVMIRERLQGAVNFTFRRMSFNLTGFNERRKFQLSGREEDAYGGTWGWDWDFSQKVGVELNLSYSTNDAVNGRNQEFKVVEYKLTRVLTPTIDASISYRFVEADADIRRDGYTENRVFATINKNF